MADITVRGPVAFNEAALLNAGAQDGWTHTIVSVHEILGELDVDRLCAAPRTSLGSMWRP